MEEERPLVVYCKFADKTNNRIIIPKFFIERNGRDFYMEVYKDKLVIKPIKEKEK